MQSVISSSVQLVDRDVHNVQSSQIDEAVRTVTYMLQDRSQILFNEMCGIERLLDVTFEVR